MGLGDLRQAHGKLLRRKLLALHAQGNTVGFGRDLPKDLRCLLFQCRADLSVGGIFGKPLLLQLNDLQAAKSAQSLFILRRRFSPIALLQGSKGNQLHTQHSLTSPFSE